MNSYRITDEQRAYLDSLVCQRISTDPKNREIIDQFINTRNRSLPQALKNGWSDDRKDKVAYYLVKEPGESGEPLLFFSLRGIDTTRFVDVVISNRVEAMLQNADKPSRRILQETQIESLFGV